MAILRGRPPIGLAPPSRPSNAPVLEPPQPDTLGRGLSALDRLSRSTLARLPTAAVAIAVALAFDGLLRWIAVATVITMSPHVVALVPENARRRAWRAAPPLLVVGPSIFLLWDLVLGRAPASRDHAIHYFQTSVLVDEMLPSGRLWGWTDRLNNGFPFGESYPTLGHLWVATPHLLSFGAIDLRTSYAWGLLSIWALAIGSVWWLAHTLAREVTQEVTPGVRWAAAVAALAWLLDPGGSRQGGWSYVMFHGVWPQMLSAALWISSLVLTWRALEGPSVRRLALAGGVLGASMLAHPFGLLTAITSALVWLAVLIAVPEGRAPSGRFRLWLVVHLVAIAIALGPMATFFGSSESMARSPVPWAPLGELATELLAGSLFDAQTAWSGVLSLLGMVVVVRRGKALSWLSLALVVGLLVLGSHAAITVLRLDLIVSGFENLQFPRYAIALKPLFFALAGVGALVVFRGFARWTNERQPGNTPLTLRFLTALVLAPLVAAVLQDAGRAVPRPVGGIDTLQTSGLAEHEAAMLEALRSENERTRGAELRVAFLRVRMGGGTYPISTIADAGAALVLDGHIPTVNFEHRFGPRTPEALAALGVTHVIRDRELAEEEEALARALDDVGKYGPYTLSRFHVDGIGRHPVTATRPGATIEVIEETPERLVIDVDGVSRRTMITMLRAPHVRWRATLDSEPVAIERGRLHEALDVMRVTVRSSGRLVLDYRRSRFETIAMPASLASAALVLLALAFPRRLELADRLHAPAVQRLSGFLVGLSVAIALVWLARRQNRMLETTWNEVIQHAVPRRKSEDRPVFMRDLIVDGAVSTTRSAQRICVGILGKDALEGCSETAHRPSTALLFRKPYLYRCLAVTVPPHGTATVQLGTNDVVGMIVHLPSGRGRGLTWTTAQIQKSDAPHSRPVRGHPTDFHLRGETHPDGIELRLRNRSSMPERVCVAAAQVGREIDDEIASGARSADID
jgi:hypothetical protein